MMGLLLRLQNRFVHAVGLVPVNAGVTHNRLTALLVNGRVQPAMDNSLTHVVQLPPLLAFLKWR
jgi:hypothetical protein